MPDMRRHNVTLSEPVSEMVKTQVNLGRYKDFSAAVQDALWNFFFGPPSPFEEYGVIVRRWRGIRLSRRLTTGQLRDGAAAVKAKRQQTKQKEIKRASER